MTRNPAPTFSLTSDRRAVLALLAGTVFWGCGFTWAKAGGETVNRAMNLDAGSALGPVLLLAYRFGFSTVLWLIIFPDSRRGWSWRGVGRALLLGGLLAVGVILQHLGLDRTSEAVMAFLTALTILFVPLMMTIALKRPPSPIAWMGVSLATLGVWLMTGATPSGFGLGELLGLAAAFLFSIYILAINVIVPRESAARMTLGQFAIVGAASLLTAGLLTSGPQAIADSIRLISIPTIGINLFLLTMLTTVGGYGLLTFFQPRVDPTRAVLIYLFEPVFAAGYAFLATGRGLGAIAMLGAGLILLANAVVEQRDASLKAASPPAPSGRAGLLPLSPRRGRADGDD